MRTYPAPLAFSLERESAHSDVYQLALLDDLGAVSEGPFAMRFSSPDEAVDWFASWTCVDVEKSPRRDLLRGLFDYRTSEGEAHVEAEIEEAERLGAEIEEAEQLAQQVLAAGGRMVRFDVRDDLGDLRGGHAVAQWLRHCPHALMNVEFENFEQPLVPHWTPSIVLPPRDDPWVVEMRAFDTDPRVYDLSLSVSRYASPVMGFSLWFSTPVDAVAWLGAVSHVDDVNDAVQSIVDQGGPVAAWADRTWPLLVRTVMHCAHESAKGSASSPGGPATGVPVPFVEALVGPGGQDVFALRRLHTRKSTGAGDDDAAIVEYHDIRGEWTKAVPGNTPQWVSEQARVGPSHPSARVLAPSEIIGQSACYRIRPPYADSVVNLFEAQIPLSSHLVFLLTLDPDAGIDRMQLSGDQRRWVDDLVEDLRAYLAWESAAVRGEEYGVEEGLWHELSDALAWTDSPNSAFAGQKLCRGLISTLWYVRGHFDAYDTPDKDRGWDPDQL